MAYNIFDNKQKIPKKVIFWYMFESDFLQDHSTISL